MTKNGRFAPVLRVAKVREPRDACDALMADPSNWPVGHRGGRTGAIVTPRVVILVRQGLRPSVVRAGTLASRSRTSVGGNEAREDRSAESGGLPLRGRDRPMRAQS
jgi:hypothetical protein